MNIAPSFSSDELLEVLSLSHNATAIHSSMALTVQTANDAMLAIWGKDRSVIGLPLEDALPELKGQPFIKMMQDVLNTGITHEDVNTPANLVLNGILLNFYFDFSYRAIKNAKGETYCLLHTATDVTERYLNEQALSNAQKTEQALLREQALNEELATTIEELSATNEELKETQYKLQQLNIELEDRVARRTKALSESEANFRNMIMQAPVAIGLFTGYDMVLDLINDKFLDLWGRERSVLGKRLADALPELQQQSYIKIMQEVYTTGVPYIGAGAKVLLERHGRMEEGFYNFINHPFKSAEGNTTGIMVVATEVTEQVKATNKVKHSEHRLSSMVMGTPISMAIFEGRDMVIGVANQSVLDIWGRNSEQVLGKKLLDVFPELLDQPFAKMLEDVFNTGKRLAIPEVEVDIVTAEGVTKRLYVNFSYDPLFTPEGEVESIMATVINITDIVEARKQLEQSEAELQALNEEVTAANEELAAANEELYDTNEELAETQLDLQKIIGELEISEHRFRNAVEQAPVAISIFNGRNLILEAANDRVLQFWGKTRDIIGLPLANAIPELKGQPFLQLLDNVFITGEPYYGNEALSLLKHNGELKAGYFNFIYQPFKNDGGQTTSIMMVATEVTEQVEARKEVQAAEEKARFAIEAANVGTWFLDIETHEFVVSPRLKQQFGYNADEEVTYEMVAATIPEDYKEKVLATIKRAIATGNDYIMEHPVIGHHDQKKRWVRAYGKLYPDANGKLSHFSGLIIDITEQKQDEMRKNDFIGMVSHELKTPLTSLSAYAQMLYNKARNNDDGFTLGALEKVNIQVKKMSAMINGFLNVSRLESGKIFLTRQDFELDELVAEMISDARLTMASHQVIIKHTDPVTVNADRDKIGSVISNLLSNAVKYSPKGTDIEVECRFINNTAQVSIKDEGTGVKPQDLEKIFDRYYRVESSKTQTVSGFGIGLYLCAEIVQRHEGKIWVDSKSYKGSTFYFTLPVN